MITLINQFCKNIKVVAVIIISVLTAIVFLQHNQIEKKNKQIDKVTNNYLFYQEQYDCKDKETRLLKLNINEFKETSDSLIQHLNTVKKELKIKDKQLKQAQMQNQEIKLDTTIIVKDNDFIKEIKPNDLTSLIIIKKDSILTAKLNIINEQSLFISSKREYKNVYKNWFQRLIHFDYKKRNIYKYQIHNSNPIIKITKSRLIEID